MSDLPSLEHLTTQIGEAVADAAALLRKAGLTPTDSAACLGAIHLLRYGDARPDGAPDAEALLHAAIRVLKRRNPGVPLSALDSSAAVGLACDIGMAWHRLREWNDRATPAPTPPPEADAPADADPIPTKKPRSKKP